MAESKVNPFTFNMSGMLGKIMVFRTRLDRTFASMRPKATNKPATEEQTSQRAWFGDAIRYGKAIIKDPQLKEIYKAMARPFESAYNVAIRDFTGVPEIRSIDTSAYVGTIGNKITVKAIDNCKVVKVHIAIKSAAGVTVEEGDAVIQINELDWVYTTTKANASLTGSTVSISVSDLAGNIASGKNMM